MLDIQKGTILAGKYEVETGPLGGGMGTVFKCRSLDGKGWRAVKLVRKDKIAASVEARALEQLLTREADVLSSVQHNAIVGGGAHLFDERLQCSMLVMEWVDGLTLKEFLETSALSDAGSSELLRRLASGLAALHQAGVAHGDLAPDNVMLPGGDPGRAKIIDLGLASGEAVGDETIIGGFKGKIAYAAPEQFQTFKPSPPADIYSLALVIAHARSGRPVPMGATIREAISMRRAVPSLPSILSEPLRMQLESMLAVDPTERPTAASLCRRPGKSSAVHMPGILKAAAWVLYFVTSIAVALLAGLWWFDVTTEPDATVPAADPVSVQPVVQMDEGRHAALREADELANHVWQYRAMFPVSGCDEASARSWWADGQRVRGVAYKWGGLDTPTQFGEKLTRGMLPGASSSDRSPGCSTGIDCSGLILHVWGIRHGPRYTTRTLHQISRPVPGGIRGLQPGDALVKPGDHVVLFAGFRPDGGPIVYEALGKAHRVVRDDYSKWSRYEGYQPVRFSGFSD